MNGNKFSKAVIGAILVLFTAVQVFPLLWLFNYSLLDKNDFFGKELMKLPNPIKFENYRAAWNEGQIPQYIMNSISITVATMVLTVIISVMLGYAFTRMRWKYQKIGLTIVLIGLMIPLQAILLPNFIIFGKLNLLNSRIGLIIAYVTIQLPISTYIMTGFMESLPTSLEEAAVMDGCNIYKIIFRVIMPLTKPAMVTIMVMSFLNSWNEFIMAATFISDEGKKTLPFSVYNFLDRFAADYGAQFAVMSISSIPVILIYILLSKHFTNGVTTGAVKG